MKSGVAKDAYLTSIRVINCDGESQTSWIIDGINQAYKLHLEWRHRYNSNLGQFTLNGYYRDGTLIMVPLRGLHFEILWIKTGLGSRWDPLPECFPELITMVKIPVNYLLINILYSVNRIPM